MNTNTPIFFSGSSQVDVPVVHSQPTENQQQLHWEEVQRIASFFSSLRSKLLSQVYDQEIEVPHQLKEKLIQIIDSKRSS